MKKHYIILLVCLFTSTQVYSSNHSCEFKWETLTQKPKPIKKVFSGSTTFKMVDLMEISLEIKERSSKLTILEKFKDNSKHFIKNYFGCDRSLNCEGAEVKNYKGVNQTTKFTGPPRTQDAVAYVGKREVFTYTPKKDGFEYDYLFYRHKGKRMGLKVSCYESK